MHFISVMRIVNQRKWSWICVNKEVFSLKTMIAFYFHLTHRESARMIVSLREWQSKIDFFVLKISQSMSLLQRQSIIDFLVRRNQSIFSQLSIFLLESSTHLNRRFFCSRVNQFIYFRMIFTIIVFLLNVETSLVENKNKNHTQQSHHQIIKSTNNHSKFQTKNLNYVSFRFVSFSVSARFNDIQWNRYNDHQKRCLVRFFTFLRV